MCSLVGIEEEEEELPKRQIFLFVVVSEKSFFVIPCHSFKFVVDTNRFQTRSLTTTTTKRRCKTWLMVCPYTSMCLHVSYMLNHDSMRCSTRCIQFQNSRRVLLLTSGVISVFLTTFWVVPGFGEVRQNKHGRRQNDG